MNAISAITQLVSVAQWSEHWTVAPRAGGSSPLAHPNAPVAQWIRASASGAEGRRFKPSQARHANFVLQNSQLLRFSCLGIS